MKTISPQQGPLGHRLLVWVFSLLLGLLAFWFLGFIVSDIGGWRSESYNEIETRLIDATVLERSISLNQELTDINRQISEQKARQIVLRDSTGNSERTMNQLLEIQRLSLQQGAVPSAEEQDALARSKTLFLDNQEAYQRINESITDLNEQLRTLEAQKRDVDSQLTALRVPVQEEFHRVRRRHEFKVATLKLLVLTPLLVLSVWLFVRFRSGLYRPVIYAFGIATLAKVLLVMHEHFPRRYFKYILILASLVLVYRILVSLLRTIAHPKRDWLLRQYREAYERFLCPICGYPIRRGPLRFAVWVRRKLRLASQQPLSKSADAAKEAPYVCPVCSTRLYEECDECQSIRPSLLPSCDHCGAERELTTASTNAPPRILNP